MCHTSPQRKRRTGKADLAIGAFPRSRFGFACAVLLAAAQGCIQEMANQPRYEPLEASAAFADGMSSRLPVPGTIARGQLQLDDAFFVGKTNGVLVTELPERALAGRSLEDLIARGRARFTIYCSHCHGQVGGGAGGDKEYESLVGMVVRRGYPMPQTYHQDRLRQAPIGHFFDVITNGKGRMPPHRTIVSPADRWAIAEYIRVLQLSQQAPREVLSPDDLEKLTAAGGQSAAPISEPSK